MTDLSVLPRGAVTLAVAALFAAPAHAAIVVYTTQASFAAAVPTPSTDSLDDLMLDFAESPLARVNGLYSYSVAATGGLYAVGTPGDVWLSTDRSGAAMTFGDFGNVFGFGGLFFGSDFDGAYLPGQSITVTATDSAGTSVSTTLNDATTSSFAGFVSTDALLSQVRASIANPNYFVTVDDVTMAVPEPGSFAMSLAGLALIGALKCRRHLSARVSPTRNARSWTRDHAPQLEVPEGFNGALAGSDSFAHLGK